MTSGSLWLREAFDESAPGSWCIVRLSMAGGQHLEAWEMMCDHALKGNSRARYR